MQLSTMVPDVPRNEAGNIDGTVLMQYVIDYILDLELQLGGALTSSLASRLQECREPLSEKTIHNIVHTQVSFIYCYTHIVLIHSIHIHTVGLYTHA